MQHQFRLCGLIQDETITNRDSQNYIKADTLIAQRDSYFCVAASVIVTFQSSLPKILVHQSQTLQHYVTTQVGKVQKNHDDIPRTQ